MAKTLSDEIFSMSYMAFVTNGTSVLISKKLKSAVFKNSPCFSYFNLFCTNTHISILCCILQQMHWTT